MTTNAHWLEVRRRKAGQLRHVLLRRIDSELGWGPRHRKMRMTVDSQAATELWLNNQFFE